MKLTEDDISRVCRLVDELSGIQWDASKTYLIETRLPGLLREHQCATLAELVAKVRSGTDPRVRAAFIDAITTRETLFFRDESPFEALKHKALPEIIDAKAGTPFARRLRLWSAACSSGQEPYSLGIVLRELIDDLDDWDVQILATDISPAALAAASKGVYSDFEVSRGLSPHLRDRYFTKVPGGWKISDEIRALVCFDNRNLLKPFGTLGSFDVIFCRNVAIYFDAPVKRDLFERLAGVLAPHGTLFVGSSENLSTFGERWKPQYHCRGVFYQPNRRPPATPNPAATARPALSTTSFRGVASR
uniref:protein-glutamate O-methyltransferase n=1 Tax=Schlesneria paludicola TaxID=360056 RepID=A0A7C2JZX6_9PLAN